MRLRSALESPDTKARYVRRLFSTIADRYDFITSFLSYGQDRRWKRRLVAMANVRPGIRALDLACGTGDITFALHDAGASAVGLDITSRMVELARAKTRSGKHPTFLVGDVPVIAAALSEIRRVLRPDGVLLSLDFNRPAGRGLRAIYLTYLTVVGAMLGLALHGDPDTYRYIPESIRRYPGADGVCAIARGEGFAVCEWVPVLGGLMAIHRAVR